MKTKLLLMLVAICFAISSSAQVREGNETNTVNTLHVAKPEATIPKIAINMYRKNLDGSMSLMDGAACLFGDAYRDIVDMQDSKKVISFYTTERVQLIRDSKILAIERRKTMDTVLLSLNDINTAEHQLEIINVNIDITKQAFLLDKYLNHETVLAPESTTYYNFSIDAGVPASSDTARFRVVFRSAMSMSVVLPVQYSYVRAFQKDNQVCVNWKVENEVNAKEYEIERSSDGITFSKVASLSAHAYNNNNYSWIDNTVNNKQQYYRVAFIAQNGGRIVYSPVMKVNLLGGVSSMCIAPNPVIGNNVNVWMENMEKGTYVVRVLTMNGTEMVRKQIFHQGGNASQVINLPASASRNMYWVELTNIETGVKKVSGFRN